MDDSGWQTVKPDNLTLITRRVYSDTEFKIFLSDIVRLWSVEGTAHDLLTMCQKENPLCEFEQSKVLKNIFNLFDKNLHSLKVGEAENGSRTLKMCTNLGNMPFNMLWLLKEQTPNVLFKEVTYPLLLTAQDLTLRQDHLCHLLKQKDAEIVECRATIGAPRWGRAKSENELFIERQFKTDKFMVTPQNRADPINFSGSSDLLSIWNTKINCDGQSDTCSNRIKIEPLVNSNKPEMSRSHSSHDVQIKSESSEGINADIHNVKPKVENLDIQDVKPKVENLDIQDVKPKVENSERKDEEVTNVLNGAKPKRRKKVKLNL